VLPSSPATRNIIGADELALMKPTSLFVNCGRGDTVDTEALVQALQANLTNPTTGIAGAVLDVVHALS
jgi:phosphoglycerate dehydrogenase-like enzyme